MLKDCDDCIHRIDSRGWICKGDGHYSKGYCNKFQWKEKRLEVAERWVEMFKELLQNPETQHYGVVDTEVVEQFIEDMEAVHD